MGKLILVAGLILIIIGLNAQDVSGFSLTTSKYIASKSFPEEMYVCQEQLLQGSEAPLKSENWDITPEFSPVNWVCPNNDAACTPKTIAKKYLETAFDETEECKKAFNLGVFSTFYSLSQTPSNWLNIEPECKSRFEGEIEDNIRSSVAGWSVLKECGILNEEGTIGLTYNNQDLNSLIINIETQAQKTEKDFNEFVSVPFPDEKKKSLLNIIQTIVDANKSKATVEELDTQALKELFNYSCVLPETRKQDLYEKWKSLDSTGKNCLTTFLAQTTSNAFTLAANCYYLAGGTQVSYNQQALSIAQFELVQYVDKGFGEQVCTKVSVPTVVSAGAGFSGSQQLQADVLNQPQTGTFDYEVCEYRPKNISQGCVENWKQLDKFQDEQYQEGLSTGMLGFVSIMIVAGIIVFVFWTSGG